MTIVGEMTIVGGACLGRGAVCTLDSTVLCNSTSYIYSCVRMLPLLSECVRWHSDVSPNVMYSHLGNVLDVNIEMHAINIECEMVSILYKCLQTFIDLSVYFPIS